MGLEMELQEFCSFVPILQSEDRYTNFCKLGNEVMLWLCGVYVFVLLPDLTDFIGLCLHFTLCLISLS